MNVLPLTHDIAINADASSQPLLNLGLLHSPNGAWGVKGTVNNMVFGPGVLLGVGVAEGPEPVEGVDLGVEMGLGVVFGSDSNPGSELVRVDGVFIDRKAINEIKRPAPGAVINKNKYNGIFLIDSFNFTRKPAILKQTAIKLAIASFMAVCLSMHYLFS
ncbi:MAG: hypothetical protein HY505_00730 [Candidatus Yanofskybacteria bacterium]|nr:hypothetical protein [Candidatus Yanofskybacteria bacterium]